MGWLREVLSIVLSGLWQGFLDLFGMSDAKRLERAEIKEAQLRAQLQAEKDALDVENKVAGMSADAVDAELRAKWH